MHPAKRPCEPLPSLLNSPPEPNAPAEPDGSHEAGRGVVERPVSVRSDGLALHGTLCEPHGSEAIASVLLIAGSGRHDRNQNGDGFTLNLFNAMAAELAAAGVVSLRADKRGCGDSEGDFLSSGHEEFVADARVWLDFLVAAEPSREAAVFVLGHSEGAVIAPRLVTGRDDIAGQVLLAPFVEPFETLTLRQALHSQAQIDRLPGLKGWLTRAMLVPGGSVVDRQRRLFERVRTSEEAVIGRGRRAVNAKWLRELLRLDPAAIHARANVPTLAIGGSKDVQCLPSDVEALRAIAPERTEGVVLADLTHILRHEEEEEPTLARYPELMKRPLDGRLVPLIVEWMKRQRSSTAPSAGGAG